MASTYSTNLGIELIGTGDQAGAWGNTTNTNLGTLVEQAISGYVTQAVATGTDTSITIPNGATGVARNMYIELTGTGGTNTNLIVPANKKLYFIYNNSTGAVTVKVAGQTGVSVPNGTKAILVCNGTDIVDATSYINGVSANITVLTAGSATITNLRATSLIVSNALGVAQGGTGSSLTPSNGQLLVGNGTGFTLNTLNGGPGVGITNAAGSITITATGTGFIASVNATSPLQSTGTQSITISLASAVPVSLGGTGQTAAPANGRLLIGNGTSFVLSNLTAGSGVSITNGAGSITISATGSTGDITFTSAVISTANTNQSMILDANGGGRILLNTTSDIGVQGTATAVQISGSPTGNLYPLMVQTLQWPRACATFWNNDGSRGSNNGQLIWFLMDPSETFVGSITYNSSAGQVNYNQTSDRRIKTIYGPTTDSGVLIDGLKVYDGKMAMGTLVYPMMIADEIQQVAPYCVTGQPNAVDDKGKPIYQQVDYSSMVPLLIAELQSLRARVAALESKS